MNLTPLELRRKRGDLIQFYKLVNQIDALNLVNNPLPRDSLQLQGPSAATRGNSRRVRSQSFSSRENNDFCSSVSTRLNFFTNRTSKWWNKLPNDIVVAKSVNSFKAKLDNWLEANGSKLI
jgi:hypothetical protein